MKVVVTGGAGFLGQRLIGELLQRGALTNAAGERRPIAEVVAVDQVAAPAMERVRSAVGDVGDPAFIGARRGRRRQRVPPRGRRVGRGRRPTSISACT